MPGLAIGNLDRLIRIERPVADNSFDGAGSGQWEKVDEDVWCSIDDSLPGNAEKAGVVTTTTRRARVRMYFRTDITSNMRFVETTDGVDGRAMQIVSGPAEIGRRDGLEFMVENYSPAGSAA